jgi:hypothetical protein
VIFFRISVCSRKLVPSQPLRVRTRHLSTHMPLQFLVTSRQPRRLPAKRRLFQTGKLLRRDVFLEHRRGGAEQHPGKGHTGAVVPDWIYEHQPSRKPSRGNEFPCACRSQADASDAGAFSRISGLTFFPPPRILCVAMGSGGAPACPMGWQWI